MSDGYESVEDEVDEVDEDESEDEEVATKKKRREKKWKDPTKPKRAMSAFFLYSQANRAQVKADNPEANFGDVARILSAQYKALPEKEMKKYAKQAESDKVRFLEEMKDYVPMEEPGGKRKKAKKDPAAPKRNMSAFFLFSIEARPKVKAQHPDAAFGDIARIISAQYKQLSEKEKKKWATKAAEDKARYQREMEEFNA